jgi:hypothetical protein
MKIPAPAAGGWQLRRSSAFFACAALGVALLTLSLMHAALESALAEETIADRAQVVAELGLTDLALFTEARYTRHPSQADLHSPFQDHPAALDRFPTGSLVPATDTGAARP